MTSHDGETRVLEMVSSQQLYRNLIQVYKKENNTQHKNLVALMEYLIETYTNENETVLDFTMGSGSTGVKRT